MFQNCFKSIEVSIVIISLPTLLTKTSRMPLVTIYGDDDHYHINNRIREAEMVLCMDLKSVCSSGKFV